jgi:hypothetical protein
LGWLDPKAAALFQFIGFFSKDFPSVKDCLADAEFPGRAPQALDEAQLRDWFESGGCETAPLDGDLGVCADRVATLVRDLSGAFYGLVSLLDEPESDVGVVGACVGPGGPSADPEELLWLSAQAILLRQPLLLRRLLHRPLQRLPASK